MRNGNVMYELGIAHALRMPEEVIIVRSDKRRILFDINQVRVHHFNPDSIPDSTAAIVELIGNAIKEIDFTKDVTVERISKKLDYDCVYVMAMELEKDSFAPSSAQHGSYGHLNWTEARSIFRKLQELGIFETFFNPRPKSVHYRWTPFGKIVASKLKDCINGIRR